MINLTPEACRLFLKEGARVGYEAVFSARAEQLLRDLRSLDFSRNDAAVQAARIQGQLDLLEKHFPKIWPQVEAFAAEEAVKAGT